ncbi:CfaE/CblD family pilus tip adhesin [Rahnella aquatilis]|uniref:CblD like pilus biogenesis initiator n=1 Tax=Rahnella aquatilis (strain ATCC 33071 / DSM 4594 / JCM 1683 / NBRC 105701 / NCIMB 13365 / CIP 78.65) TaxID=745277 RepID=H2J133_RAHAC|nr:CfaE/CblD family pilus tip adhesin [Rahnella aquatilis]AEX53411.1 CblD like pilus biogenesis initiator [Rahnella aquatilis CIP 78.65 = ATCC 33071]KFD03524.1 alpha-fimbriae tip adhesin [Rahnella aquatilis CIP 78.65 = ATCC 33071]
MKLSAYLTAFLLLIGAQGLITSQAYATRVEPTGRDTPVTSTFDKSSPPSQIDIWKDESGGYDNSNDPLWGRNTWTCLSSSNPVNGQCSTSVTGVKNGSTTIPIIFTEKRSHITQVINLTGYHEIYTTTGTGCGNPINSKEGGPYLVNAGMQRNCEDGNANDDSRLTVYVNSQELQKLPTGGIWEANLKMNLMQWDPRIKLADWNAHITLNVTDNNNQQIYLPEFGQAAPRVDLNLRPLPGTGGNQAQMTGRANIDMCLYDGYGSNSSSFTLKFEDQPQGSSSPSSGNFFIYTDHGDVNQSSGWIEYFVQMVLPDGNKMSIMRGHDIVIPDIQNAHVRPVHLPGIPQAVLCVPMPIELDTKAIDINSKQAGHYTGHLIVTFTSQL